MLDASAPPPAAPSSTLGRLRYQLVAWFGILGAAVTLVSHLRGVIHFAQIAKPPVSGWIALITGAWRKMLFFAPAIQPIDAVLLSLFSFLVMNSINASFRPRARLPFAPLLIVVAAIAFGLIFLGALPNVMDERSGGGLFEIYINSPLGKAVAGVVPFFINPEFVEPPRTFLVIGFVAVFIVFFLVPLIAAVIAIALLDYAFRVHFNLAAFTVRIWKILFCFSALLSLNYLALWWEQGFATPPSLFLVSLW